MHPLIIGTYLLNLLILNFVFGVFGLFFGILFSGGVYYVITKKDGTKRKDIGQKAALVSVHLLGALAIVNAPWSTPSITAIALIMELFIVAIFLNIGRR